MPLSLLSLASCIPHWFTSTFFFLNFPPNVSIKSLLHLFLKKNILVSMLNVRSTISKF